MLQSELKMKQRVNSMPLVSICVITYNQVHFISETLQSALQQDYENIEIVVADDGSTDGTAEAIMDFARLYPKRIVPLIGGQNLGITGNSNRGLTACKGKYIAFLGGDDIFLPGKITKQVEWLEADKKRVLCYHDIDVFDSSTGKTLYLLSEKFRLRIGNARTVVTYGTFFGATSVMVRYSAHILFNENISIASDWLMWIEILEKQSGTLGYVEGVYARYRRHANNITLSGKHNLHDAIDTLDIFQKYASNKYEWECNQKRAEIYFLEGYKRLLNDDFRNALFLLFQSVRVCHGVWIAPLRLIASKTFGLRL